MAFPTQCARFALCAFLFVLAACGSNNTSSIVPATSQQTAGAPDPGSAAVIAPQATSVSLTTSVSNTVGLFQVFDQFGSNVISSTTAATDGPRYGAVWGSRVGMATPWRTNNTGLAATYYMPQETDANTAAWGDIGHTLTWWKANHPDWILYACNASGTPTTTPAYIPQLPNNVPLDIHNPAVVAYQVKLAANYAHSKGYTGLAFDEVLFTNITGMADGTGYYGCGIYQSGKFVRRYTGRTDPAWTTDTVAWVKAARSILKTDTVIAPYNLKLIVNHPAANVANANEQAILQNVDADLNETGYSDYGAYQQSTKAGLFKVTTDWVIYAQAHGTAPLIVDKFDQTTAITSKQLEYSIATYLMGHQGTARLFVGNSNGYGIEQYHGEYATNYGAPCGAYYGGAAYDSTNPQIYYRRFA
ncbi:MAG TPA: hypothetical protein VFN49_05770, partial [Candidatus Aquilonibacter sp.]|nr:hypothetical protein [Candidatus Aquilonibacter sp.]